MIVEKEVSMVDRTEVSRQLNNLGVSFPFFGRPEINELPNILCEGETIKHILNGRYESGFALLCATDHRLLLIDKKLLFLTIEDVRYDMVSDVQFAHILFDSSIHVGTVHKTISFKAFNHSRLRALSKYVQEEVMSYRKHLQRAMDQENSMDQDNVATNTAQSRFYWPSPISKLNESLKPITYLNPYRSPLVIQRRFRQSLSNSD